MIITYKFVMTSLMKSVKGAIDLAGVVVDVVLVVALIPVISTFITNAENLTATETLLLSLVTLFIVPKKKGLGVNYWA